MAKNINEDLIEDYRNVITNEILNNEILVDVLSRGTLTTDDADELVWHNLLPQEFDPETITETESYIFYDINEATSSQVGRNGTGYVTLTLFFWVLTHRDIVRYEGNVATSKNRLRNDIIVRELKKTFAPQANLGISKNRFLYNNIFTQTNYKYTGRLVAFKITDFADKIRYGVGDENWQ